MLDNFNKIDYNKKLSLFRDGSSASMGFTDVTVKSASKVAMQMRIGGISGSGGILLRTSTLQLNKDTVARFACNNPDANTVSNNFYSYWGGGLGNGIDCYNATVEPKCDTPTIKDNCLTGKQWFGEGDCGDYTGDNCGWWTLARACGCSHLSWWLC